MPPGTPEPYDHLVKRLMARAVALPPRAQDAALALALVVINVGTVLPYGSQMHPLWLALFLVIAQAVPLAWRRSYPLAVLIVAGIPRILYDQLAFGYAPIPLANTIAFYTAMVYCRPAVRRVVIVLTVIGSIQSQIAPGHTQPYDAFVSGLTTLAAWLAAVLVRTRRAYIQEVENRVVRAETERDDEAARAAAAERTRIARELHDVVAHHVSLMAVQAEAATSLLPGRPAEAAQSVEVIAATARQALTELRRLLGVLRGPADQLETAPSVSLADLGTVLDQVRRSGLAVDLTVEGTPGPLAPSVDLTAYRIIQEALTNTVRHANAARAAVTLCYEPGFVTVSVTDTRHDGGIVPVVNGTVNAPAGATLVDWSLVPASTGSATAGPAGTGPASAGPAAAGHASPGHATPVNGSGGGTAASGREVPARSGGFGLAGIAERVASCGGHLSVGPTGAGGFAVTARLPAQ
jgi:signal transduction histidine kinase